MLAPDLVDPKKTAVLVIDLQVDYCSPEGAYAKRMAERGLICDMSPVRNAISRIAKFLFYARSKKIPIIWTRMIEHRDYVADNLKRKITFDLCDPRTPGYSYFEIAPRPGDTQIIKKHYDAFSNNRLQRTLKAKGARDLIVTGVYTAMCVDTTVRSASRLGYHVVVPKDLVAMPIIKPDPAAKELLMTRHEAALFNWDIGFAHLSTSEEIERLWTGKFSQALRK